MQARAEAFGPARVWYTQGFNPHIYMTLPRRLPLGRRACGIAGLQDGTLPSDWEQARAALQGLPEGVRAVKLEPAGMAPTKIASAVYEIQYPAQMRQDVRACRAGVQCSRRRWWKRRAKRENEADGSQASISRPWNLWKQVRRFWSRQNCRRATRLQ